MKIVIIARHFPPAVSGGARRPFVLHECLRALGHQVFVVAPQLPDGVDGFAVPHPAESRHGDGIVRAPDTVDPLWRKLQRDLTLWPDPDRWWANRVVEMSAQAVRNFNPALIFSTAPPESVHHAGYTLSQALGVPWIADFRDNWLENPLVALRKKAWRRVGEVTLARRWLRVATLICAPTEAILAEMQAITPHDLSQWLYPQLYLPPLSPCAPHAIWDSAPLNVQRILHLGSFTLSDPDRFLAPVLEKIDAANMSGLPQHLFIAGRLTEGELAMVDASLAASWLGCYPSVDTWSLLQGANALLMVASPKTQAVPGKLAEYLATGLPILAVGEGPWRDAIPAHRLVEFGDLEAYKATRPAPQTVQDYAVAQTSELLLALEQAKRSS